MAGHDVSLSASQYDLTLRLDGYSDSYFKTARQVLKELAAFTPDAAQFAKGVAELRIGFERQ